jgi:hypothetical protein
VMSQMVALRRGSVTALDLQDRGSHARGAATDAVIRQCETEDIPR